MKYENQNCPVCEKVFTENDEIVVCPECGTPHHKECYFSLGECKNKSLHNEGFSYKPQVNEKEKLDVIIEDDVKKTSDIIDIVNVEYKDEDLKNNEELRGTIEELFKNINGKTTDQVLINKTPSSFYEAAVGQNQNYYMPRFLIMEGTNKKSLINFFAFLFPLGWSVYRKMYKIAILVFCIYIALMGISVAPVLMNEELMTTIEQCVLEDPNAMQNILAYQNGQSVKLTKTQAHLLKLSAEAKLPDYIIYGKLAVSLAIKFFFGLNATILYKKKLEKNIKKVIELPLDDNAKKKYLKSKYGVAPMAIAVIIGFIEYFFLARF